MNKICARDILVFKKTVGAGVSFPDLPVPVESRDGDQFKGTIRVTPKIGAPMEFTVFVEVVPESTSLVGKKMDRHLHGFIMGDFDKEVLIGASYEVNHLTPHSGFSLVGVF